MEEKKSRHWFLLLVVVAIVVMCPARSQGPALNPVFVLKPQLRNADHAAVSADGRIGAVSSSAGSTTTIFEIDSGRPISTIPYGGVVSISPDGSAVVIGKALGEVIIWTSEKPQAHVVSRPLGSELITAVAITRNADRLFVGTAGGNVVAVDGHTNNKLWNQDLDVKEMRLEVAKDGTSLEVHASRPYLLRGSDGEKRELPNYRALYDAWKSASTRHNVVYFQGDKKFRRLYFIANDVTFHGIICIDAKSGREIWRVATDQNFFGLVEDRYVYFLDLGRSLKILNIADGAELMTHGADPRSPSPITRFDETAHRRYAVSGNDSGPRALWDMESGRILCSTPACGASNSFAPFASFLNDQIRSATCRNKYTLSPTDPLMAVIACNSRILEMGLIPPKLNQAYTPPNNSGFQYISKAAYSNDGKVLAVVADVNRQGEVFGELLLYRVGTPTPYASIDIGQRLTSQLGFDESSSVVWLVTNKDIYGGSVLPEFLRIELSTGKVTTRRSLPCTFLESCLLSGPQSDNGSFVSYVNYGAPDIHGFIWSVLADPDAVREIELPLTPHRQTAPAAISSSGAWAAYSDTAGDMYFYDIKKESLVWRRSLLSVFGVAAEPREVSFKFSKSGSDLFASLDGRSFRLASPHTTLKVSEYAGGGVATGAIKESSDGLKVFVPTASGVDIFDALRAEKIGSLHSLDDGGWLTVSADGRFDAGDVESLSAGNWVMADDPLRPLPLEIFMREFFEPRLLPKMWAGHKMERLPNLEKLNRVQPRVVIKSVELEKSPLGRAEEEPDTVSVVVEVAAESREFGREDKKYVRSTDAYDLRLFRDGQLVDQRPAAPAGSDRQPLDREQERAQWRKAHRIVEYAKGTSSTKQFTFTGVRLPRLAGKKEVEFAAYAFNEDQVKSETDRHVFVLPKSKPARVPRAYIVTIGVNTFSDASWNLQYAANDAREAGSELKKRLEAVVGPGKKKQYEKVVWVPLISDTHDNGSNSSLNSSPANKPQIEAVLKTLSGQASDVNVLSGIGSARDLRRANPEDLVIIVVSTHGIVDERGSFYFLPANIGSTFSPLRVQDVNSKADMLARAVSNDELAQWLRGLDAVDQVMIIDACHSAASVETAGFKPGPMGSPGLGQLAYDKGMRILAATQVQQQAIDGSDQTRMGLLIYALIQDGLRSGKADSAPKDGRIMLSEWLSYANQRVPGLFEGLRTGTISGVKGTLEYSSDPNVNARTRTLLQQPSLFDFGRGRDFLLGEDPRPR